MIYLLIFISAQTAMAALFDDEGHHLSDRLALSETVAWKPLDSKTHLTGIGLIGSSAIGDLCTTTLIDTGHEHGPAYILTNAHCNVLETELSQGDQTNFLKKGEVRQHRKTSYYVVFKHFVNGSRSQRKYFSLKELTYITEHETDMALYQINRPTYLGFEDSSTAPPLTLEELKKDFGIHGLKISKKRPMRGEKVGLVGALLYYPGMFEAFPWTYINKRSLYVSSCQLQETVALINGVHAAPESVVHQCSSIHGFSGGPLLSQKNEIVLLNSHGSTQEPLEEKKPCDYEDRPCEILGPNDYYPENPTPKEKELFAIVQGKRVAVKLERNYGQYVDRLALCFSNGEFKLDTAECRLPRSK